VLQFAPRLDLRLLAEIDRRDDGRASFADIWRAVGDRANRLGQPRPSYEHVRRLVHERRESLRPQPAGPPAGEVARVALEVAYQRRPPEALIDALDGASPPPLRRP